MGTNGNFFLYLMLLLINKGVFCDSDSQNLFGKIVTCYLMAISDGFIKFSAITDQVMKKESLLLVRSSSPVKCCLHRQLHVSCF